MLFAHQESGQAMWSIYGAERTQPATIGRKSESFENGSSKPNPLPSIADSCAHNEMVREGVDQSRISIS